MFRFWSSETFMPFSFSVCSSWMAQMSKADSVLCGGYKVKRVNKVKHVFVVSIREGQVQHEWINEKVCACMCVHLCVCVGVVFERENIVCGCCIFDELAQHNGPVEGCGGSFQTGITRRVSASTFNAASYNNLSKKIFLQAAEPVLGQQTPPGCCRVTRHTSRSKSGADGLRMELHEKMLQLFQTFSVQETSRFRTSCCCWDDTKNYNQVTFSFKCSHLMNSLS